MEGIVQLTMKSPWSVIDIEGSNGGQYDPCFSAPDFAVGFDGVPPSARAGAAPHRMPTTAKPTRPRPPSGKAQQRRSLESYVHEDEYRRQKGIEARTVVSLPQASQPLRAVVDSAGCRRDNLPFSMLDAPNPPLRGLPGGP